ncbi:MAG: Zn-ribbon domain-containing protein [Halalkalicoccus sp.]
MPHQCTECGHTFADGSKEMLSGCPECGGNKFQFLPAGANNNSGSAPESATESAVATDPEAPPESAGEIDESVGREDSAQADARSSMVDANDLPTAEPDVESPEPGDSNRAAEPDAAETPDLSELREELNEQFESIRIVDHGQYELNLMELYKREEFIIALRENGRYVIDVPESFRGDSDT